MIFSLTSPFVVLICAAIVITVLFYVATSFEGREFQDSNLDAIYSIIDGVDLNEGASANQSTREFSGLTVKQSVRWQQHEGPSDCQFAGRILCVGSTNPIERMACLGRRLAWTRSSVDLIDDFATALEVVSASPRRWNLLIVDIDHSEKCLDIDDIVRELIAFREDCSSCAIALVSMGFSSDDGSLIRSFIADYSFRATVSDERLIETLPEVFENHRQFLKRRTSLLETGSVLPFGRKEGA